MKQKTKKIVVFIAEDGKEFITEAECVKYEKEHINRYKNMCVYRLWHSPDLTEGRGLQGAKTIVVEIPAGEYNLPGAEALAIAYAMRVHGLPIGEGPQGYGLTTHWTLRKWDVVPDLAALVKETHNPGGGIRTIPVILITTNATPIDGVTIVSPYGIAGIEPKK